MKPWKGFMQKNKEKKAENIVFFFALFFIFIGFALFYRNYAPRSWDIGYHTIFAEKLFHQSMESMAAEDSNIPVWAVTYPLYHLCLKTMAFLLGHNYYAASYLLMAFSIVIAIVLYREISHRILRVKTLKEYILCDLASIFSVIFVTACSPLTNWRLYDKQCAANPVHNPTILFVRPMGLLSVLAFLSFLEKYEKKERYGVSLAAFGIFSVLSVFAKPNFAFVFLIAMAVLTLEKMIAQKSIRIGILALIAALPSALAMLFQFTFVSDSTEAMHVVIRFGSFSELTPVEVFAVSLATFPVPILLFSKKLFLQENSYRMAYYALLIGWLQMFFLTNGKSGDFSWGYDLAVQFSTLVALCHAMKANMAPWRRWAAWLIYGYQTCCGIYYLVQIFRFHEFLI